MYLDECLTSDKRGIYKPSKSYFLGCRNTYHVSQTSGRHGDLTTRETKDLIKSLQRLHFYELGGLLLQKKNQKNGKEFTCLERRKLHHCRLNLKTNDVSVMCLHA